MVGSQLQVVATGALVKTFCRICLAFQNNTELVQRGGADCFPRQVYRQLKLFKYEECQSLVEPRYTNGRVSMSMIGVIHNKIKWMTMAFESVSCCFLLPYRRHIARQAVIVCLSAISIYVFADFIVRIFCNNFLVYNNWWRYYIAVFAA